MSESKSNTPSTSAPPRKKGERSNGPKLNDKVAKLVRSTMEGLIDLNPWEINQFKTRLAALLGQPSASAPSIASSKTSTSGVGPRQKKSNKKKPTVSKVVQSINDQWKGTNEYKEFIEFQDFVKSVKASGTTLSPRDKLKYEVLQKAALGMKARIRKEISKKTTKPASTAASGVNRETKSESNSEDESPSSGEEEEPKAAIRSFRLALTR